MARALRPQVILLDVMMPQMDGWSVLTAIRSDPDLAATPVIMVSFVHEEGLAASLGANDYLSKPIEWDALSKILSRYRVGAAGDDILVVDDDDDTRTRLTTMLNRSGFKVRGRRGWRDRAGDGRRDRAGRRAARSHDARHGRVQSAQGRCGLARNGARSPWSC